MPLFKTRQLAILIVITMLICCPFPSGSFAVYADTTYSIADISSFQITDLNSGNQVTVNPKSGIPTLYIFGGISSCLYTVDVLNLVNSAVNASDESDNYRIYAVDIKGNKNNALKSAVQNISNRIIVGDENAYASFSKLYSRCYSISAKQNDLGSIVTMPLLAYVDVKGNVVATSWGSVIYEKFVERMQSIGAMQSVPVNYQTHVIKGTKHYAEAMSVLAYTNAYRSEAGAGSLQMDRDLMEIAMNRAAECALYYSHTRPNGEKCYSISDLWDSTGAGENIAAGQETAEEVSMGWKNSSGHYANMINSNFKSIGVGSFEVNGSLYWVQCFSTKNAANPVGVAQEAVDQNYSIVSTNNLITPYLSRKTANLEVGEEITYSVLFRNSGMVAALDTSSYQWNSDMDCVSIDQNGKAVALSPGTATITAVDTNGITLTGTITVPQHALSVTPLGETAFTLKKGDSAQLQCVILPEEHEDSIAWVSSSPGVASVSKLGVVTAKSAGETDITVKAGSVSASWHVTVYQPVTDIGFSKSSVSIQVGNQQKLAARVSPTTASNKVVTYSTSNPSVATVAEDGTVTAVAAGTAIISATAADGSGCAASYKITVTAPKVKVNTKSEYNTKSTARASDNNAATQKTDKESTKSASSKTKQNISVKCSEKTVKASKLKKASRKIKKSIEIKNAHGTITYTRIKSGSAKTLTIDKKGVITVKQGTKKGSYKIRVKIKAAGDSDYKSATKTVTVKVRVK